MRAPPNAEPWPELPEGETGLRGRVSRLHPPPLIEETARGVIALPPDTDSLRLVFDGSGRLVRYAMPDTNHYAAFPNFVKTTGAIESHVSICVLLRLLNGKFMNDLEVTDDTELWNTWNAKALERKHAEMRALIGIFRQSKDQGGLLRKLGVDIPEGKVELLGSLEERPAPKKKTKKPALN